MINKHNKISTFLKINIGREKMQTIWFLVSTYDSQREPLFYAIFVFGDSLVDNGNNNKLHSIEKANYMPYGIDFPGDHPSPTRRFFPGDLDDPLENQCRKAYSCLLL
jgi:hypothetical protein